MPAPIPARSPAAKRGTELAPPNRFASEARSRFDDGWAQDPEEAQPNPATQILPDQSRSILSRNDSPDVGFDLSLNPYRGCEHGCVYCYARPTHEFLGLSAGLDFETRIFAKEDAAALLRQALGRKGYVPEVLGFSGVTDPWQPAERRLGIARACLQVFAECRHPIEITTKGALILRDADLLAELARHQAVRVTISITTLDRDLARRLEPRAATPERRLAAIRGLAAAGVPVGVGIAPVIPGLTEDHLAGIAAAAAEAGAQWLRWTMLRLPYAVKDLMQAWLEQNYPDRTEKVLNRVREMRGGALNTSQFGERMKGKGVHAELVRAMALQAARRHGLALRMPPLSTAAFRPPGHALQGDLFT